MFLDYLSLVILLMGLTLVFYGFIYIHEIPHKIALKREVTVHLQKLAQLIAGEFATFAAWMSPSAQDAANCGLATPSWKRAS
jgi:hypothetical protein